MPSSGPWCLFPSVCPPASALSQKMTEDNGWLVKFQEPGLVTKIQDSSREPPQLHTSWPVGSHHVDAIASPSWCYPVLSPAERSAGRPCPITFLYTLLPLKALVPRNPIQTLTLDFSVLFHGKSVTPGNRQENATTHLDFQYLPLSRPISGAQRNDPEMTKHDCLLFQSASQ